MPALLNCGNAVSKECLVDSKRDLTISLRQSPPTHISVLVRSPTCIPGPREAPCSPAPHVEEELRRSWPSCALKLNCGEAHSGTRGGSYVVVSTADSKRSAAASR